MHQYVTQLNEPPVIGQIYIVPTIDFNRSDMDKETYYDIPVLLPGHIDYHGFVASAKHYHIDHRFSSEKLFKELGLNSTYIAECFCEPYDKEFVCVREMPMWDSSTDELDEEFKNIRIRTKKGCRVCPHQGIKLDSFIKEGQRSIRCPGHGLHWNLKTGELIPDKLKIDMYEHIESIPDSEISLNEEEVTLVGNSKN